MKIDAKILLGRILQKMIDQGYSQVSGYNKFTYLGHAPNKLTIGREAGQDTDIYFDKILLVIEAYKDNPLDYDEGPSKTRNYGLVHVNSPVWSMVHLLDKEDYE